MRRQRKVKKEKEEEKNGRETANTIKRRQMAVRNNEKLRE